MASEPAASYSSLDIGYVTDVEGNYDYFQQYVAMSSALRYTDAARNELELKPGACFVFGGDVCDKGSGDLRIMAQLIRLKRRYPDRVVLIMGNRDFNKMRLTSELADSEFLPHRTVDQVAPPYWVPKDKQVTARSFVEKTIHDTLGAGTAITDAVLAEFDTKINRLKWMMNDTMGCQTTFELRREELRQIAGIRDVSDEDVINSYVDSVAPGGVMREYLRHGSLAFVLGDTLVVHGGLTKENIGWVPGDKPGTGYVEADVQKWCNALNTWMRQQVADWEAHPFYNAKRVRGGELGMDYGVPGGAGGRTVVYQSHLHGGQPVKMDAEVVAYLERNGVQQVLLGHTPHGEAPTVIRHERCMAVMADTSYSDMSKPDNRGRAVSEVRVRRHGNGPSEVFVHGIISSGAAIQYSVAPLATAGDFTADPFIGRSTRDGRWIKSRLLDPDAQGRSYILSKGHGFSQEHSFATVEEVNEIVV